jgi:hypothetical protein
MAAGDGAPAVRTVCGDGLRGSVLRVGAGRGEIDGIGLAVALEVSGVAGSLAAGGFGASGERGASEDRWGEADCASPLSSTARATGDVRFGGWRTTTRPQSGQNAASSGMVLPQVMHSNGMVLPASLYQNT